MTQQVPLVDWNDYRAGGMRRDAFITAFGDAFRHFGFVRLAGHDVDVQLLSRMYALCRQLFSLTPDTLRAFYIEGLAGKTGYTPFRRETAVGYAAGDEKHFWHVCREEEGPNIWPSEQTFPALADFRRTAECLYRLMDLQYVQLMEALEIYLKVPAGTLIDMVGGKNNSTLRLLHYPPLQSDRPAGAIRAGAHKDINMLTLLPAATSSGLEVQTLAGEWVPIAAIDGELIVNVGLMLERVTNGFLTATPHQVVNPNNDGIPNDDRYSLPFFGHPLATAWLAVHARFRGIGFPTPPPPVTGAAALAEVLQAINLA